MGDFLYSFSYSYYGRRRHLSNGIRNAAFCECGRCCNSQSTRFLHKIIVSQWRRQPEEIPREQGAPARDAAQSQPPLRLTLLLLRMLWTLRTKPWTTPPLPRLRGRQSSIQSCMVCLACLVCLTWQALPPFCIVLRLTASDAASRRHAPGSHRGPGAARTEEEGEDGVSDLHSQEGDCKRRCAVRVREEAGRGRDEGALSANAPLGAPWLLFATLSVHVTAYSSAASQRVGSSSQAEPEPTQTTHPNGAW